MAVERGDFSGLGDIENSMDIMDLYALKAVFIGYIDKLIEAEIVPAVG